MKLFVWSFRRALRPQKYRLLRHVRWNEDTSIFSFEISCIRADLFCDARICSQDHNELALDIIRILQETTEGIDDTFAARFSCVQTFGPVRVSVVLCAVEWDDVLKGIVTSSEQILYAFRNTVERSNYESHHSCLRGMRCIRACRTYVRCVRGWRAYRPCVRCVRGVRSCCWWWVGEGYAFSFVTAE